MPHVLEITEENAHAAIPPYLRQKVEDAPTERKKKSRVFDGNAERVFRDLEEYAVGATADQLIEQREKEDNDGLPKVNQVAPVLSNLRAEGIIIWSGKRLTRMGKPANVHVIAEGGKQKLLSQLARTIN